MTFIPFFFFAVLPEGLIITSYGRYKLINKTRMTYEEARTSCTLSGGHLAALETQAEFDALITFSEFYLIGLNSLADASK